MSTLVLVRHAQASFASDDYDQLSSLGERQARQLGQHWVERELGADAVFAGPRRRQIQTALIVGAEIERAQLPWPELKVLDALDEYGIELGHEIGRQASHPRIGPLIRDFQHGSDDAERRKRFQLVLQELMRVWADGGIEGPDVETFADFEARVSGVVKKLTSSTERGKRIVAFTSAGVIGMATGQILKSPLETQLELGWAMLNGSVTEVLFSNDRRSLSQFNAVEYAADSGMRTYR